MQASQVRARRHGALARLLPVLLVAAAAVVGACTDVSTAPDSPFSLEFSRLPFPAVVAGDTLRDTAGVAAPLRAIAFNARGDTIAQAPITYHSVGDTAGLIRIDAAAGTVTAEPGRTGRVDVIATIGGLQSERVPLRVVLRPDSVARVAVPDTIFYSFVDSTRNVSTPMQARVLHQPAAGTPAGVQHWVVRYRLENLADTVKAALLDDSNRRISGDPRGRMHIDTTSADGLAARKLRVIPGSALRVPLDSVAVQAEVLYRGAHVSGSPVRFMIFLAPRI